jgi:aspartate 1-decarboxylase
MRREFLRAKIHRATVTETRIDYEGSLTVDLDLMSAADLRPFERVDIYNIANGERLSTYVIPGVAGSGTICVNGAAARLASRGDKVIIAAYASLEESEVESHRPAIILVDEKNRALSPEPEAAGRH